VAASKNAIIIHQANDGTAARIWAITNDATAAVASGEIVLIGNLTTQADQVDLYTSANFVLV
jgi:hypothetical protein